MKNNPTYERVKAANMAAAYEARIAKQSERIALLLEFLESEGLVEEFNGWEEDRAAEEG